MSHPLNDEQYEETTIKSVDKDGTTYTVADGWCFGGCTSEMLNAAGVTLKPGDLVRHYWRGSTVRGVFVNGVRIYYRTEQEDRDRHAAEALIEQERKQAVADVERPSRDATRAELPDVFQRRLARFEAANPRWRRDFEPYELSCCVDAAKIADALKTGEEVQAFAKMPWAEQKARVPGLFDGHSGNSFGMAVRLAYHYATHPERVVQEHGALCNLVGCEEYGDHGKVSHA